MANSRRFKQLQKRIVEIESNYLPTIKPLGNYTVKEQDDLRAFLLLVHAEIEYYFEIIAEEKVKACLALWNGNRKKSNVLLALLAFCDAAQVQKELSTMINLSAATFYNKLKSNHGIKDKNIFQILLPIGVEKSSLDVTWLATITSFGANRGFVAHTASIVQNSLDPVTLKGTLTLIISEINNIDRIILGLK